MIRVLLICNALMLAFPLLTYSKPRDKAHSHKTGKSVMIKKAKPVFDAVCRQHENKNSTLWNGTRSDTYMYQTCMKLAGWKTDYDDLITISGFGPGFIYSQDKWWAHYLPPPDRDDRIAHSTGFRFNWQQKDSPEDYFEGIKQAIDAGNPVYGPHKEGVLFIGYRDAEQPEDRQVAPLARFFVDDEWWSWDQFVHWYKEESAEGWFGCYKDREDKLSRKEAAIEVLTAMHWIATDDPRKQDDITWGVDGIRAYAADVADTEKSGADTRHGGFFQDGWRGCFNIYPQMSGRSSAAVYLRRVAPRFSVRVKGYLFIAAEEYAKATKAWQKYEKLLGRPLGAKQSEAWEDPDRRKAGADAIYEAAEHEQKALDALAKALEFYKHKN